MAENPEPATNQTSSRLDRLPSIDALRGIAALMVAGYHVWGHYGVYPFPSIGVVPQAANPDVFSYLVSPFRWGYLGVSLFLVLSGFCIHLPQAKRKGEKGNYGFNPREFYLRRLWRLYPAYFVAVFGGWLILLMGYSFTKYQTFVPSLGDLVAHLTLTHGYFDSYFFGIAIVFWSLALEFQLYLAYPIYLFLFRKIGLNRSLLLLVGVAITWRYLALTIFHNGLLSVASTGPYTAMGSVLARMPEWLFGVWLAEWYVAGRHRHASRIISATGSILLLALALLSTLDERGWVLTDVLFGLGFATLIAATLVPRETAKTVSLRSRTARFFVWTGTISYSIYLFHTEIAWLTNPLAQKLPGVALPYVFRLISVAASIVLIGLLFRLVEKPFLRAPRPGDSYYRAYKRLRRLIGIKTDTEVLAQPA